VRVALLFALVLAGCPDGHQDDPPPQDQSRAVYKTPPEPMTDSLRFATEALVDRFNAAADTEDLELHEAEGDLQKCLVRRKAWNATYSICIDALNTGINFPACDRFVNGSAPCCTGRQEKDGVKVIPGTCDE